MVVVVFSSYHAVVGKWETRSAFQVGFIAVFSTPVGGDELSRGAVSKRRMWAVMVVAGPPERERELPSRIGQVEEDQHWADTLPGTPLCASVG